MTPAISVTGLTRRYRGQVALDDITLELEPDSITGLLGRNGAGKTTFLRIIAGHEFASAGTVALLGANPVESDTALRQMVFVREDQTYPDVKVRRDRPGRPGRGDLVRRAVRGPGPDGQAAVLRPAARRLRQHPRMVLALMLAWGMWFGIVYRRWNVMGLLSFIAAQALALTAVLLIIGGRNDWHAVARFFTTLTIEGLTGLLAALTVALLAGGYATVRRLAV